MAFIDRIDAVNRVIHPSDSLAPVYGANYGMDEYFRSALRQVDALEVLAGMHMGKSLTKVNAIADFACHYGRLVRALRIALPTTQILACDIDNEAISFCAREFKAQPFYTAWSEEPPYVPQVEMLVCISLLTHTRKTYFEYVLNLWARMIPPGGLVVFTYLGDRFISAWEAGEMAHYGPATADDNVRVARDFRANGHAFHGYRTPYSETEYGVGFLSDETVKASVAKSGNFVLLEMRPGPANDFGQDVAVARRLSL